MKLIKSLVVAAIVAVPVVSFAQSSEPLTRAQVRAELVQLEKAGYNPTADYTNYPQQIQAAEARVSAQNGVPASGFGGVAEGSSAAGARAATVSSQQDIPGLGPIYAH
ncbi:DUF4148 domain-containing protein [Paraburkholderia guartelaensis]|uniref:DUF4148 domain-containing protein n=1 Tax=Paraburkholderia guartelaensis TaxID=2546446 RepID=A0A4R5LCN6_9BURK|nr:DUF4148 domain-containing protein [Paraburkholderia guartelaensis]TDG07130.1 DUF4148 domain-containing protein [Paraburkholderia guartelaensis]